MAARSKGTIFRTALFREKPLRNHPVPKDPASEPRRSEGLVSQPHCCESSRFGADFRSHTVPKAPASEPRHFGERAPQNLSLIHISEPTRPY